MLYSSLNNISIDTQQETVNAITENKKLEPATLRVELIKVNTTIFYVINGDNADNGEHSLIVMKYNIDTNSINSIFECVLFEGNKAQQVAHNNVWKQNGQYVYYFEKRKYD